MTLKMKVGRLILSLLFTCIFFTCVMADASSKTQYTPEQEELLVLVKKETIELIESQKSEAESLRRCFAFSALCSAELKNKIPSIRKTIHEKSAEYRLLVGLSRAVKTVTGGNTVKIGLTIPGVTLETSRPGHRSSELEIVQKIYRADIAAIKKLQTLSATAVMKNDPLLNPQLSRQGIGAPEYSRATEEFYETQALLLANQIPFIIYFQDDEIDDLAINRALGLYIKRIQNILNEIYDDQKNPLDSFLIYSPIVENVIQKYPVIEKPLRDLLIQQKLPKKGFDAWVARNSPSIKFAALTTCSLVSAILQSWPISLACGSSTAALTSKQFYVEYSRLSDNFSMWLMGAQSYQALRDNESRLIYSTFALFLSGQALSSTIMSIETGLIASLSALPSTAAARFTSLAALRDGSLRFATRTANFKGRDLGASLLSQEVFEGSHLMPNLSREERIFTYGDFIKLTQVAIP